MSDQMIMIIGQSNAGTYLNTTSAAPYYIPTARVQIWVDTNGDGIKDAFNYMNPGVNTGLPNNPTAWGPEVQIANQWLADNPGTSILWIGKEAKGSTGLAQDANQIDWSPNSTGEMFDKATLTAIHMQADIGQTLDAVFIMQGETDAMDYSKAMAYETNLGGLKTAIRGEWGVPNVDILIGRINDSTPYFEQVRWAQYMNDVNDPNTGSFDTYNYTTQPDGLHYNTPGVLQLGNDFYDAWSLL